MRFCYVQAPKATCIKAKNILRRRSLLARVFHRIDGTFVELSVPPTMKDQAAMDLLVELTGAPRCGMQSPTLRIA